MKKDRMKFVLDTAIEAIEKLLRDMCFSESEIKSFILGTLDIDEEEYNYITGGNG